MSVIRILYVEDDLNFGRMTKVFLDQAGFLVELTTNVEEAWKLFHTRRPDHPADYHRSKTVSGYRL